MSFSFHSVLLVQDMRVTTVNSVLSDVQHADVKYADACLRCLRTLVCRRSSACVDIIFSVSTALLSSV